MLKTNKNLKDNLFKKIIFHNCLIVVGVLLSLEMLFNYKVLNFGIENLILVIPLTIIYLIIYNYSKTKLYIYSFFQERSVNINDLILKKYLIYTFLTKKDKNFIKKIEQEINEIEPKLKEVFSIYDLKNYILNNKVDMNSLLLDIDNKMLFEKDLFLKVLEFSHNEVENKSFELLTDNTVISNEINELINSYKIIEVNKLRLSINEKRELNNISNMLEKVIIIFNEIKKFKNEKMDNNLILLINELKLSIKKLDQSIQDKIIKDIEVLNKKLSFKN